jgi:Kef-type K+ transport system membrane component KefB
LGGGNGSTSWSIVAIAESASLDCGERAAGSRPLYVLVGVELDTEGLKGQLRGTVRIAFTSIAMLFTPGLGLATRHYKGFALVGVPFTVHVVPRRGDVDHQVPGARAHSLGSGHHENPAGRLALSCAAIGDVTAWCLLGFIVDVVNAREGSALTPSVLTLGIVVLMCVVVRPLAIRFSKQWESEKPERQRQC